MYSLINSIIILIANKITVAALALSLESRYFAQGEHNARKENTILIYSSISSPVTGLEINKQSGRVRRKSIIILPFCVKLLFVSTHTILFLHKIPPET